MPRTPTKTRNPSTLNPRPYHDEASCTESRSLWTWQAQCLSLAKSARLGLRLLFLRLRVEGIRRLVWVLGFKVWAVGFRVYRLIAPKCLHGFKCIGFGV